MAGRIGLGGCNKMPPLPRFDFDIGTLDWFSTRILNDSFQSWRPSERADRRNNHEQRNQGRFHTDNKTTPGLKVKISIELHRQNNEAAGLQRAVGETVCHLPLSYCQCLEMIEHFDPGRKA